MYRLKRAADTMLNHWIDKMGRNSAICAVVGMGSTFALSYGGKIDERITLSCIGGLGSVATYMIAPIIVVVAAVIVPVHVVCKVGDACAQRNR